MKLKIQNFLLTLACTCTLSPIFAVNVEIDSEKQYQHRLSISPLSPAIGSVYGSYQYQFSNGYRFGAAGSHVEQNFSFNNTKLASKGYSVGLVGGIDFERDSKNNNWFLESELSHSKFQGEAEGSQDSSNFRYHGKALSLAGRLGYSWNWDHFSTSFSGGAAVHKHTEIDEEQNYNAKLFKKPLSGDFSLLVSYSI